MLKSLLLSSVRPFYEAEKEQGSEKPEKSDADKQRESIKVTGNGIKKDDDGNEIEQEEGDKEAGDDSVGKGDEGEKEEGDEEGEGEGEGDEKDEGEKEVELSAEQKEIKKLQKTIERLKGRVGKTTGERDTIKKDLAEARKALDAKVADGEQPLTEEEVDRRATVRANELKANSDFDAACERLRSGATKADKDFPAKIKELAQDVAPLPGHMIGILDDLDNGGAVLSHLANNTDEYEEIFSLPLAKMTTKLVRLSEKLIAESKPKPKPISKVPAPNDPIKGGNKSPNILTGKEEMSDFVRIRNQQIEERRKARGY